MTDSNRVLVFIYMIKELSVIIPLCPFGFSMLVTYVYENASRDVLEEVAALAIIITVCWCCELLVKRTRPCCQGMTLR